MRACCRWDPRRPLDARSFVAVMLLATACTADSGTAPSSSARATRDVADAPDEYQATDLGVLPGATRSNAWGINDHGDVVGRSSSPTWGPHAVLWTRDGEMRDLGVLPGGTFSVGQDVNDRGDVVGYADVENGDLHAFRWDRKHGMQDLGVATASFSAAYMVNARGVSVGESEVDPNNPHAARWSADGSVVDLGTFGGHNSYASGINDRGDIAVTIDRYSGPYPTNGVLLTSRGERLEIGRLGGNTPTDGTITAGVDDQRDVAGASTTPDHQLHAILWTPATGTRDLGTLGGRTSFAYDVNERQTTVGYSTTATGGSLLHAFVWTAEDGLRDLGVVSGQAYSVAHAIDERGTIVGDAGPTRTTVHAYRWTRVGPRSDRAHVDASTTLLGNAPTFTDALPEDWKRVVSDEMRRPLDGRSRAP